MAILVNEKTRLIVQGLTGREGTFHAKACAAYGTQVVGGVTPGKGGATHEGWPIFNTVQEAVDKTGADTTMIFVPPPFAGTCNSGYRRQLRRQDRVKSRRANHIRQLC